MDENPLRNPSHQQDQELRSETERALLALNCGGPSLPDLYLSAFGESELDWEQQNHVASCSVCQRALELARMQAKPGAMHRLPPHPAGRRSRRHLNVRRLAIPTGLAAAAVLVFAVFVFFQHTPTARADDALYRRIALKLVFLPATDPFLSDDPSVLASRVAEIEQLRAERDRLVRLAAEAPDQGAHNQATAAAMQPWHGVYRRLRDLGRLQDALSEAQQLVQYIRADKNLRNPHGPLKSTLADIGNIYLAMSDFAHARAAYAASITERQEYVRVTRLEPADHPDNIGNPIQTLVPLYWSMSNVAIAEGNLQEARKWMVRADAAFLAYFEGICRSYGIELPVSADVLTAYRATPLEFQSPPEDLTSEQIEAFAAAHYGWKALTGFTTKLRAHLYYRARLALAMGDTSLAQQELDAGRTVAYDACADEDRLDFNEPLLAARIAIAEKRYPDASALIAEAEQHTGLPPCSDQANNRPIASARIAELILLKGVALLGLNQNDEEASQLVEQALAVPEKLAAGLPPELRESFIEQFTAWRQLAESTPLSPQTTTDPLEETIP